MNLILAVSYGGQPFPVGTSVSAVQASITGSASGAVPVVQTLPEGSTSFQFANVAADTYTYSVQALDENNNPLGSPITGSFTVTAPVTVTLQVPVAVTASQS